MTKVVHCRDIGFDCNAVVRAKREEAALQIVPTTQKGAQHGNRDAGSCGERPIRDAGEPSQG
jgi:hypothetical protein